MANGEIEVLDLDAQFAGSEDITYLGMTLPGKPTPVVSIDSGIHFMHPAVDEYALPSLIEDVSEFVGVATPGVEGIVVKPISDAEKEKLKGKDENATIFDLMIPAHKLGKELGQPAVLELAEELARKAEDIKGLGEIEVSGMFVNIAFDPKGFAEEVLDDVETWGDVYGYNDSGQGHVAIFDNSSPNVAKFMSVAHLRSTVIGESMARIHSANGYTSIRDNHLGDWGSQFGILGHAVELWGDEFPGLQSEDNNTKVRALFDLYVKINAEIAEFEAQKAKEKAENEGSEGQEGGDVDWENSESPLSIAGREWFKNLEEGDEEALELWRWARDASLVEFQRLYEQLGVEFELWLGESVYAPYLKGVIKAFEESGVAVEDSTGVLRLGEYDPEVRGDKPEGIRKSDGTSLYATRDLATLAARHEWYNPAKIIYSVDHTQGSYFRSVFKGFKEFVGDQMPLAEIVHAEFGLMTLPEGKMSTRKGNVIFLEDVLGQSIDAARQRLLENKNIPEGADIDTIARQVGAGALIYFDLMGPRKRGIEFTVEDALNFEANSGPYVQYAAARMGAILEGEEESIDEEMPLHDLSDKERAMIDAIAEFPEVVRVAAEKYEPSKVAEQVFKLAKRFSSFYSDPEHRVLDAADPQVRNGRLRIVQAARQVMENGLSLLNIEVPEYM